MSPVILMAVILGQCSGGRCPAPTRFAPSYPAPIVIDRPVYVPEVRVVDVPAPQPLVRRWVKEGGLHFEVYGTLYDGGRKINWDHNLDFNRRSWGAARAAQPSPEPALRAGQPTPKREIQNFGLTPDKLGLHNDSYTTTSAEAKQFVLEAKGEAGDAGVLHVTVIGSVDDCAPVVNDLKSHPALAGVRERLMVQDYRPNEWAVNPSHGFQVQGKPTILVQTPRGAGDPKGGRVVYRAMSYEGGPERLAEEIRKADPSYNPSLDPGPGRPGRSGCPLGFTSDHWLPIAVAVAVALLIFFKPKVKS